MSRKSIILTFATGHEQYLTMAKAFALSARLQGTKAQLAIITDRPNDPEVRDLFPIIIAPPSDFEHWFIKLCALKHTDAEEILFIDGDCLAIGNLDGIIDSLRGSDFAVQGKWLSDPGDWYGNAKGAMDKEGVEQIPKFSGGFLYYERTANAQTLIDEILSYRDRYDELGLRRNGGKIVDEICISLAMAKLNIGKVFDDSCGFSLTPWRRVGPLELDVVRGRCSFARLMPESGLEVARPLVYHTAMARYDIAYWREVRKLLKLYRMSEAPYMSSSLQSKGVKYYLRLLVMLYRKIVKL